MSYEESMKELDNVLNKIESPDVGIEDSIRLYESGVKIATDALDQLKTAKGKITVLQQGLSKLIETNFELEE